MKVKYYYKNRLIDYISYSLIYILMNIYGYIFYKYCFVIDHLFEKFCDTPIILMPPYFIILVLVVGILSISFLVSILSVIIWPVLLYNITNSGLHYISDKNSYCIVREPEPDVKS